MNTFGGYPLYDSREPRANRDRFRRSTIPFLDRANSLYCLAGKWSSRGWVLLSRADYDQIDKYSTSIVMEADTLALYNLCVVQAQCVTRGLASDPNALYLVEITDRRGVLHNKWFEFPLVAAYNTRAPAYPQTYYQHSLNSGTPWTWSTMIQDIWTRMNSFLGTWPGLPTTPDGQPEGFWFTGVSAWTAMCDVLDHLGMKVACDLTSSSNQFTIVECNAADSAFDALTALYDPNLEDDLEWSDIGAGRVPGVVKVLFRRRNSVYGTEETVTYRSDSMADQWTAESTYTVSVNAPDEFLSGAGTHYLWSDFTVRHDDNGDPLAADVATADAIARQRTTQYFARIGPAAYLSREYAGALPFATGSRVDGVCWRHGGYPDAPWRGWRTGVVYGPEPPWPQIFMD